MSPTTIIRARSQAHLDTFDKLVEAYRLELDEPYCFQAYEAEKKDYSRDDIHIYLAFDGETVCGCIGFWPMDNNAYEMKRLYVLPTSRGQSIGEKLIAHGESELRAKGVEHLVLETLERLKSAIYLYRKRGYVPIQQEGGTAHTHILKMSCRLQF